MAGSVRGPEGAGALAPLPGRVLSAQIPRKAGPGAAVELRSSRRKAPLRGINIPQRVAVEVMAPGGSSAPRGAVNFQTGRYVSSFVS